MGSLCGTERQRAGVDQIDHSAAAGPKKTIPSGGSAIVSE
jgi:hypothetical protein